MREVQIEKLICDYLYLKKYFFWKNPSAGYFDASTKRFRKHTSPYVRKGIPDLIVIHQGQFIVLEVKSDIGRASEDQKQFEFDLKKAGGKYFIVRSLEEVEDILKNL